MNLDINNIRDSLDGDLCRLILDYADDCDLNDQDVARLIVDKWDFIQHSFKEHIESEFAL